MPRACTICSHKQSAEISKAIVRGGSKSQIAGRFGLTESAVQRHRSRCLMLVSKRKPDEKPCTPDAPVEAAGSVRFDSDDPKSLVATTARLVDEALGLLEHAKKGDDRRTALAALREARDGLALLMKAAGMLAGDGTTIHVDARRQSIEVLGKITEDELRAIAYGKPLELEGECYTPHLGLQDQGGSEDLKGAA